MLRTALRHTRCSTVFSRYASTALAPGMRPTSLLDSSSKDPFLVRIPDIPLTEPELPIQIPFVPDFWESSHPAKADEGRSGELLVVAAAETQFSASPTHKLVQDEEGIRDGLETSSPKGQGGLLNDMAEDMGIPIDSIYKLFK